MYYTIVDGEPFHECDINKWAEWFESAQNRQVERTQVAECVDVSTCFLGVGHGYRQGEPVLWETMVFGGDLDGEQERYTSEESARKGHVDMVKRCQEALGDDAT